MQGSKRSKIRSWDTLEYSSFFRRSVSPSGLRLRQKLAAVWPVASQEIRDYHRCYGVLPYSSAVLWHSADFPDGSGGDSFLKFDRPSAKRSCSVRSGVPSPRNFPVTVIRRMAEKTILFVCTGNTCRSPMAEELFRQSLSNKLGCEAEELGGHGYVVASAGLAAGRENPASPESVNVLQRRGLDISEHRSQPLTAHLLERTYKVFTMTRYHREVILRA